MTSPDLKPCVYMYLLKTDQVGIFVDSTKNGIRVKHMGVIPYDEIRVATQEEVDDYYSTREDNK